MSGTFYITTPIYYVNGLPHIGHAYTTIAADVATRWQRLAGRDAFLLTGTDEHGQKVLERARALGVPPEAYCDDVVVAWKAMWEKLGIGYDRFIRTTDADHVDVVRAALAVLHERGLLEKRAYEGWYHTRDEVFVTEKDVEEGRYDRSELQRLTEENWFFRMSQFQGALVAHIEANPGYIRPTPRKNEVLGFLRKPLGDLCITRPKVRMDWGVELPFDTDFVTYVWVDALLNYLTGIGWHPDANRRAPVWSDRWPPRFQLLGKDILTTHAVYWSTLLLGLGVPLPTTLYAHGWWTSADGAKISKSLGNAIDVGLLADSFGVDATRYFFVREIAFGADGGFSYDGFLARYNSDLANDVGNLAHRGLSMTRNWLGGRVPPAIPTPAEEAVSAAAASAVARYADAMDDLQFQDAIEALWELVRAGNKYIDSEQPWALNKAGNVERLGTVLRTVLEVVFVVARLIEPVMPAAAGGFARRLGVDVAQGRGTVPALIAEARTGRVSLGPLAALSSGVDPGEPSFPRFREQPAAIARLFSTPAPEEKPAMETPPTPPTPAPAPAAAPAEDLVDYDTFAKLKLRSGRIVAAEKHAKADRLLVLAVDVGEERPRTIVAGIANEFTPDQVVGRSVVVVANLKPAKLRGVTSEGMLLAAGGESVVDLVAVDAPPGTIVR